MNYHFIENAISYNYYLFLKIGATNYFSKAVIILSTFGFCQSIESTLKTEVYLPYATILSNQCDSERN